MQSQTRSTSLSFIQKRFYYSATPKTTSGASPEAVAALRTRIDTKAAPHVARIMGELKSELAAAKSNGDKGAQAKIEGQIKQFERTPLLYYYGGKEKLESFQALGLIKQSPTQIPADPHQGTFPRGIYGTPIPPHDQSVSNEGMREANFSKGYARSTKVDVSHCITIVADPRRFEAVGQFVYRELDGHEVMDAPKEGASAPPTYARGMAMHFAHRAPETGSSGEFDAKGRPIEEVAVDALAIGKDTVTFKIGEKTTTLPITPQSFIGKHKDDDGTGKRYAIHHGGKDVEYVVTDSGKVIDVSPDKTFRYMKATIIDLSPSIIPESFVPKDK